MVSYRDPFYDKLVDEALKKNKYNLDRNSWWYLHGKLEEKFGYDKAVVINLSEFPEYLGKTLEWKTIIGDHSDVDEFIESKVMKVNGIIPVKVSTVIENCIGYFWTTDEQEITATNKRGEKLKFNTWAQRGLVCLENDNEANNYAKKAYYERRNHI